jgi:hypothetical protein
MPAAREGRDRCTSERRDLSRRSRFRGKDMETDDATND